MRRNSLFLAVVGAAVVLTLTLPLSPSVGAQTGTPKVDQLRMYIFDLGFITVEDASALFTEPLEVAPDVCCIIVGHLIVHPRGTLMWDVGMVPDALIGASSSATDPTGQPLAQRAGRPLTEQLAEIGYTPDDITYVALSHYHFDHTANANLFENSTWITQKAERDAMFAGEPVPGVGPEPSSHYNQLRSSRSIILSNIDEYDVFGDGTVIIKSAPGHTPGHQVLILHLPETGPVMLAGDLYHFPEEREAQIVPVIEFDKAQSRQTRIEIEDYVRRHSMPLWIEHDAHLYGSLEMSPAFIE